MVSNSMEGNGDIYNKSGVLEQCESHSLTITDVVDGINKKEITTHIELSENLNTMEELNPSLENNTDNVIVVDDGINELEDLLEEQIMLSYIKKMKSNLPIKEELNYLDDTSSSSKVHDDSESLFDFDVDANNGNNKFKEIHDKIVKALTINAIMQIDLNTFQNYLTKRLIENRKNQERLKETISTHPPVSKSKICSLSTLTVSKFGMPYFKDKRMFTCPQNSDVKSMLRHGQLMTINFPFSRKWKLKHKLLLELGIKSLLVQEQTADWCEEESRLKIEMEDVRDKGVKRNMFNEIRQLRSKIDCVNKKTLADLCLASPPTENFPWIQVSADHVISHSSLECEAMWNMYVNPLINKTKWTVVEDKRLIELAKQKNHEDWDLLAKRLNTSRSGYQCFLNYQTRLNKYLKKSGKWSEEEDRKLIKMVSKCRVGDFIPWPKISYYFEGRTLSQVYCRWHLSLNPDVKKGRFTKEEDKMIVLFVRKFGEDFTKIAKIFGDRTNSQLRERYYRAVRGKYQNTGRWSLEEDTLLMSLSDKYGPQNYSAISKQFLTRTRTQIRQRLQAIKIAFEKDPTFTIDQFPRGPKANSQISIAVAIEKEKEVHEAKQSIKSESELEDINDLLKREARNLTLKAKSGRKRIKNRSGVDAQLISYFKESYTTNTLRHHTQFLKPENLEKAAFAMSLLCKFLQTHVVDSKLDNNALSKVPTTLRRVIKLMNERSLGWGCNCLTENSLKLSSVCICVAHNYIDCFPNKRISTMVGYDTFMLTSLPEFQNAYTDSLRNCHCDPRKVRHVLPYYLPPNLLTAIGFRSALLMKDKIAHSLSFEQKRTGYFVNINAENETHGIKNFTGFFSDEDENDADVNLELHTSSDKTVHEGVVTDLPSTSRTPESYLEYVLQDVTSESVTNDNDSKRNGRLSKQDAINLWKERLLAILGWPIILSNQSAAVNSSKGQITSREEENHFNDPNQVNVTNSNFSSCGRKRKKEQQLSYTNKLKILESNEVLKTKPIIVKEKRYPFQLFEDALSADEDVQEFDDCETKFKDESRTCSDQNSTNLNLNKDSLESTLVCKITKRYEKKMSH